MLCPHCRKEFHTNGTKVIHFLIDRDNYTNCLYAGQDAEGHWWIMKTLCPSCGKYALHLGHSYDAIEGTRPDPPGPFPDHTLSVSPIRPKASTRPPVPVDVPSEFAKDYLEACLVLADSPSASAALSRRCLQHVLREKAGVKENNLYKEIEVVVAGGTLPSDVSENLDYIRKIGNLGAHPTMNDVAGEIVPVEREEAEWCLEVIESLFDFYFVRPADSRRRREAFDSKMSAAKSV